MSGMPADLGFPRGTGDSGAGDGIEPALSAWESDRSGPLTALSWAVDAPLVTVRDPATPGLMARQWPVAAVRSLNQCFAPAPAGCCQAAETARARGQATRSVLLAVPQVCVRLAMPPCPAHGR